MTNQGEDKNKPSPNIERKDGPFPALNKDAPFPLKSSPTTVRGQDSPVPPNLENVEFTHIRRSGSYGVPKEAKRFVVNSWDDYQKFFDDKEVERPDVNFDREELLAVSMGEQTTDGYAIEIVSVKHGAGFGLIRTYVEFVEKKPKPGQAVEDVMTYPVDLIKVKKLPGTTEFFQLEPKEQAA